MSTTPGRPSSPTRVHRLRVAGTSVRWKRADMTGAAPCARRSSTSSRSIGRKSITGAAPRRSRTGSSRRPRRRPPCSATASCPSYAASRPAQRQRADAVEDSGRRRAPGGRVQPRAASAARWRSRAGHVPGRAAGRRAAASPPNASSSSATAMRHGCRMAVSPPAEAHRPQRRDPADPVGRDQDLAAPRGAVGAVSGAVEGHADTGPSIPCSAIALATCAWWCCTATRSRHPAIRARSASTGSRGGGRGRSPRGSRARSVPGARPHPEEARKRLEVSRSPTCGPR